MRFCSTPPCSHKPARTDSPRTDSSRPGSIRRTGAPTDVRRTSPRGRGSVSYVEAPFGSIVIRHYRRGGLIAHVLDDFYVWNGDDRTRGFAEFRLLARLRDLGLPVPSPIAARYVRSGPGYRGDLITRRIDNATTFADLLNDRAFRQRRRTPHR